MRKGFTLIEIVIAIGILAALGGMGLLVAIEQYRTYALEADLGTAVSLIQRARTRAMANIGESEHGFYTDGINYVLFRGPSYANRDPDYDEEIPVAVVVNISGTQEFVFSELEGIATPAGDLTLDNNKRSRTISVNDEGRISW
ncbi:MAG: prepilin-type N-terminal cleavage/methylation domain-containing protein [Candidatus Colwellbacteria bacterium]|nr:prepilin-type N-terminal cleavage/methylation domain-containing protein [Candidatus Colwellbacteria bacterium]